MAQYAFCQMYCFYNYIWSHSYKKYFYLLNFRTENGVAGPLKPKYPNLGVAITTMQWLDVALPENSSEKG